MMFQKLVYRWPIIILSTVLLLLFACDKKEENVIFDSKKHIGVKTFNESESKYVNDNKLKVNNDTSFLLLTKPRKGQTSETWSGITFPFQEKIDFKKGKVVSFKAFVYDSLKLLFELEPIVDPQHHSYVYNRKISQDSINKWLEFHLDYSDFSIHGNPKEMFKLTFFLNYLEHLVENKKILIDDIYLGTKEDYYLEKMCDFETPEQIFYPFGGSGCQLIQDPENKNNTVLEYIKPVGNRQIDKNASFICKIKDTTINIAPKIKLRGLIEKPCEVAIEVHGSNGEDDIILESKKRYHAKDLKGNWRDHEFEFKEYSSEIDNYKISKIVIFIDKGASLKAGRDIMISPEIEFVYSNNSKEAIIDFQLIETVGGSIKKIINEDGNGKRQNIKLIKNTVLPLSKVATTMIIFNQSLKVNKNQKLTLNVNALLPNLSELKIELLNDTILTSTDYSKSIQINSPDSLVRWLDMKYNYNINEEVEIKSILLSLNDNNVFDQPVNLFLNKISYSIE